jgi:hypothetical protein
MVTNPDRLVRLNSRHCPETRMCRGERARSPGFLFTQRASSENFSANIFGPRMPNGEPHTRISIEQLESAGHQTFAVIFAT